MAKKAVPAPLPAILKLQSRVAAAVASDRCWIGIDGSSDLRVVLVNAALEVCAQADGSAVNPSVVGQGVAAERLQDAIRQVLRQADRTTAHIVGVGIGMSGTSPDQPTDWLQAALDVVLPNVPQTLSSTVEIALAGAHGREEGILLLAGNGCSGYAINAVGERLQVGSWEDGNSAEGSASWMGRRALKIVAFLTDEKRRDDTSAYFKERVLDMLEIRTHRQMLKWIYKGDAPAARVATLAPLVLVMAQEGNPYAEQIAQQGVHALVAHAHQLRAQLDLPDASIAFAGSLPEKSRYYRGLLAHELGILIPVTQHPPAVGAALLSILRNSTSA